MTDVHLLDETTARRLQAQPFTYPEVGRVLGETPRGYRRLRVTRRLPDHVDLDTVTRALMTWQLQARAGLQVAASSREVEPEAVVVLRLGLGRLALTIPCRVVTVVDERDRRGFTYGTLPGHPERGEEAFVLDRHDDGAITITVSAFSRPASRLARLGGPISAGLQTLMTQRYVRAVG